MQNFDHNIVFSEKRQFSSRKLSKIAENCVHNIDPWGQIYKTWTQSYDIDLQLRRYKKLQRNYVIA
jgi:hypothetical protein